MDNFLNFNTDRPFNYSGYGAIDDGFDSFDETVVKNKNSSEEVYNEILAQLCVDKNTMLGIINCIVKTENKNYKFVRIANDFQTLFFEDDEGHLTPITLQKLIDAKNQTISKNQYFGTGNVQNLNWR